MPSSLLVTRQDQEDEERTAIISDGNASVEFLIEENRDGRLLSSLIKS